MELLECLGFFGILELFFGIIILIILIVSHIETLKSSLKRVIPPKSKDFLWFWFYWVPTKLWRAQEKILLEELDKRNIVTFLEMDYQYSEHLVRLYDKFYTNYVVIWDRLKNNVRVYNLLCDLMKSKMIKTFKNMNVDRNNAHIRLSPSLSSQRKLETIIIDDRQEFGREMQNKMKMPNQNNDCRCFVVPMLTEEVINYAIDKSFDVKKGLIFTILEIPSEKQFKEVIKNADGKIVYAPLISQEIIKNYYREKYNT